MPFRTSAGAFEARQSAEVFAARCWVGAPGDVDSIDLQLNMGLSENSVPLNPMVNDHYPY